MAARRFVLSLLIALVVVFTACSQTPTSAASQNDVEILAKPGGGGGKVKTVTAAELGLEIVVGGSSGPFNSLNGVTVCPDGKTVIGGGFKEDFSDTPNFVLTAAYPANQPSGQSGFHVTALSSDENQIPGITLYAVCING